MKKIKIMILVLCMMLMNLTISQNVMSIEAAIKPTTYSGDNLDLNNYSTWNDTRTSFLALDNDKLVRIQQLSDKKLLIENYDSTYHFIDSKLIEPEGDYFGGAYVSDDANYLVWGNINPDEDDTKQVFRISKYDKNWNYITSCGLNGANTTVPFDAGTCDMTMHDNHLIIRTCHEMYQSEDGYNHQANVTIMVNTDNMEISYSFTEVSYIGRGYVSHSFNQLVEMDGNDVIMVDHGDAYPRSIVLIKSSDNDGTSLRNLRNKSLFTFAGDTGLNRTGASLGGLAISSTNYLVTGNSIVQDDNYATNRTRNIFVLACDKQLENVTTTWLTNYPEGEASAKTPYITKVNDHQFIVMWSRGANVYYCVVDENGAKQSDIVCMENTSLSDCEPIEKDGKVVWYTWNNENINFYQIDPNDLIHPTMISFNNGNRSEKGFCCDGVHEVVYYNQIEPTCIDEGMKSHYECSRCKKIFKSASEQEEIDDTNLIISALGHDWISHEEVANSCDRDGIKAYQECNRCDIIKLADGSIVTDNNQLIIPKHGHQKMMVQQVDATCSKEGTMEHYKCSICDIILNNDGSTMENVDVLIIPKAPHTCVKVDKVSATCFKDGIKEYYRCLECQKLFDENNQEINDVNSLVIPKLSHDLKKYNLVAPTCTSTGMDEHYSCNICHSVILKDKVSIATSIDELIIPILSHEYQFSCYSNGKYYQKCIHCNKEIEGERVFIDVDEKAWFNQSVYDAYANGYMKSTGKGKQFFEPDMNISRGMVATVLYRMAGAPKVIYTAKFPDVKENIWYTNAIMWASKVEVVKGFSDGKFGPDTDITRQDLAIMLRNYASKVAKINTNQAANLNGFKDKASVDDYAKSALQWAVANEIMSGKDKGTLLAPRDKATRAECAKMFNALGKICKQKDNELGDLDVIE